MFSEFCGGQYGHTPQIGFVGMDSRSPSPAMVGVLEDSRDQPLQLCLGRITDFVLTTRTTVGEPRKLRAGD